MTERILSHFRLDRPLGEGGMGVVWEATDLELERPVALKVLRPEFLENEDRRARFLREARTAAKVTHPNLATIYEIGEHEGEIFLAMELVRGRTLREEIRDRALPTPRLVSLASQIADGLSAAHSANVIHRDLKPENVMVDPEGRARILDFGLAKLLDDGPLQDNNATTAATMAGVTRDGRILGTVAYMSPEQARGRTVDARSDIFSFGIILYEMATGISPFVGETHTDTLTHILRDDPPPVWQRNPDVPAEFARVIQRCLEKDPEHRYPDSRELAVELRMIARQSESGSLAPASASGSGDGLRPLESGDVPAAKDPHWPKRRFSKRRAVVAAVLLTMFWLVCGRGSDDDETTPSPRVTARAGRGDLPEPPRPPAPVGGHTLAIMPFRNLSDEADSERLGQILQELIITDLSDNEKLRVFSSQRLYDIQEQLGGDASAAYDRETASRIARQAGAQTLLEGTLSHLGGQWIVTAQLVDAGSGTVVGSQRVDGDDLYAMVDELTDELRAQPRLALGPGSDGSVRDRTSSSLEAQRLYLAGTERLENGEHEQAVALLEQAIEADPGFGQAYYKLALARWWSQGATRGGSRATLEPLEKILRGEVRATPRDKAMAGAAHALFSSEWDDAIAGYEAVTEEYPDEKEGWYGLGEALYHSGRSSRPASLPPFERAIALDPGFTLAYEHVFDLLFEADEFESIVEHARNYLAEHPDDETAFRYWARAAAADGDEEEVSAAIAAADERFGEGRGERLLTGDIETGRAYAIGRDEDGDETDDESPAEAWNIWDSDKQSIDEAKLQKLLKGVAKNLPGNVEIHMDGEEGDADSAAIPPPPDAPR
jgi:serine/threonine protein kinase/TolB-like protein